MWMEGVFSGLPSAWGHLYVVGLSRLGRAERRHVLVLHLVSLLCRFIVVEQRRCIVEGLKPQTGYESGCCSYSEWRGQSAQGHCSKETERRSSPLPGPSERPAGPALSDKRKQELASLNADLLQLFIAYACVQSHMWTHMWGRLTLTLTRQAHVYICSVNHTRIIHGHLE